MEKNKKEKKVKSDRQREVRTVVLHTHTLLQNDELYHHYRTATLHHYPPMNVGPDVVQQK